MTDETTDRTGGRRRARGVVPWGLLGMIALAAAAERGRAWAALDVPNVVDDWVRNARVASRYARGYDVLCLGDSALKFGVGPTVVERRTGRPCYNLGLMAGSPLTSEALLRRALDGGARPSAVVIEALPYVLALEPRARSQTRWPKLLSWREALALARDAGDPGLLGPFAVGKVLASSREREVIRAGVVAALKGQADTRWQFFAFHARNWDVNRGAQILQPVNNLGDPEAEYREYYPGPGPWACHPVNAACTTRLLDLAASNGVRVYWLLPPIEPAMQAVCDERGTDALFERFVRGAVAGRKNVVVVDARRAGFDRSWFADPVHLNRLGAEALSEAVAAELNRAGAPSPRWVTVDRPPPDGGPPTPLEDLDQSRVAIGAAAAARLR